LAKLSNFVAKRHPRSKGVFNYNDLTEAQQTKLLSQITVDEVWGVGRKLTKRLGEHGIQTVQDLRLAHTPTLRAEFGVVIEKTQRELQGIACIDLQEVVPDKQQIISSRSFGSMVQDVDVLKDAMSTFVANACAKLRAQDSHASVIQVFLHTNRFRKDLPQYMPSLAIPLPMPTNDSLAVNMWACHLIDLMFKPEYQYKKAGVVLSEISPTSHIQGDLLVLETENNSRLMTAIDQLNSRFGRGTVKISTQGAHKNPDRRVDGAGAWLPERPTTCFVKSRHYRISNLCAGQGVDRPPTLWPHSRSAIPPWRPTNRRAHLNAGEFIRSGLYRLFGQEPDTSHCTWRHERIVDCADWGHRPLKHRVSERVSNIGTCRVADRRVQ
jgi:hypothetical protein